MYDSEDLERIRESREEWEADTLGPTLERFGERQEQFTTDTGGQPVDRLYTPEDVSELDYDEDLGFPGEEPYTRGPYPTMYRGRLWTMRQYAGFGTPDETNERFHYLLDQGQTGLSMAFDLPTQMGYDSDATMAQGEVGKSGVHRHARGLRAGVRGHPAGRGVDVDDHQRASQRAARDVHRRRRQAGRRP